MCVWRACCWAVNPNPMMARASGTIRRSNKSQSDFLATKYTREHVMLNVAATIIATQNRLRLTAANPKGSSMVGHARAASTAKTPDTTPIRIIRRVHEGGCSGGLELPPIGWLLFILSSSRTLSTAFPAFLDTYTT